MKSCLRESSMMMRRSWLALVALMVGCASPEGTGLLLTPMGSGSKIKFDVFARPLPEIPLPNDFATRFAADTVTRRRINASLVAPTDWEKGSRVAIAELDGWGTYQSITVGFEKPLDLHNIIARHVGDDYASHDDAVLLLDITPDSPTYCQATPLDLGEGNFPLTLERQNYFFNDSHNDGEQLVFEDREEDVNHNGQLDLGEDIDGDGVLDHPNTLYPGLSRRDVVPFYEKETNTLIVKPVMPLRETTTYAVVLTNRLVDEDGRPIRSPFDYINHTAQTKQLEPMLSCLPRFGLARDEVAFAWAYTTQSITREHKAIRDGLYGHGTMAWLHEKFPPEVVELFSLRGATPGSQVNVRIVPGDVFRSAAVDLLKNLANRTTLNAEEQGIVDSHAYIDFHVVFSFESPQFFRREGPDGKPLKFFEQLFEVNATTGAAFTRPEKVIAWLTVPKNRRGPAPLTILGHGYTGNKLDPLYYGGYFAKVGLASVGMENVSHGLELNSTEVLLAKGLLDSKGLQGMGRAIIDNHRAFDQNGDGIPDSGADFWTAYIGHTRDVVRQTAIDYAQLIRVIRSFNGAKTWRYDGNGDGADDLAGDFDGDGVIDVGGSAPITMTGGSLGGIMSAFMAGTEPQLEASVPVSGGAGLPDIGVRSTQGGVVEAVNLRMFGPLLVTCGAASTRRLCTSTPPLDFYQMLPDTNSLGFVRLGAVPGEINDGDTAVLHNLKTNEMRCFRVNADGLLRAAISSDTGDQWRLELYPGALPPVPKIGCEIPSDATPRWAFDALTAEVPFQGVVHPVGEPLTALGDGYGLRRQTPEMRRFMGLAQLIIERGDPVNWVPYAERWNLDYATGERVRTRMLVVNTVGDPAVPVATGSALARAAGFLEFKEKDARWGKTPNRVLIDNGTLEGTERFYGHLNSLNQNVHVDVENFAAISGDDDKFEVPRLNPPLRLVKKSERLGGYSGVLYPMISPRGRHGFGLPNSSDPFDTGAFMVNLVGRYLSTNGEAFALEPCLAKSACAWLPQAPPP